MPADLRLIEGFNLKIDESILTGETIPALKDADAKIMQNANDADMLNMAFATTLVTGGHAKGLVIKTGMQTRVGSIAKIIIEDKEPKTPIQRKLTEVGKTLGIICLSICFLIFVIGLFKKIPAKEMFMTSVGLAVAAIPEGLPAIVTIMLSIGVTKMARKNAIIRKLSAVETLGSSNVICSDKTGTLTQNKMQVLEIYGDKEFVLELGTMCNDCEITNKNEVIGDPTEVAIVNYSMKYGIYKDRLYSNMKRINEISFDSDRKLMTTIHKMGDKYRIVTKGAVDILLDKCNKVYKEENTKSLNSNNKNEILLKNINMADSALRVIAVAYKDVDKLPQKIESNTIENELTFVGLIRND